jgi:hypothetical protein
MLVVPGQKLPPRAIRPIIGGPFHAAALNQQQRPDHWTMPEARPKATATTQDLIERKRPCPLPALPPKNASLAP